LLREENLMSANVFKLVACVVWAAVAVSSATPASAVAAGQVSPYEWVSCSPIYGSNSEPVTDHCGWQFPYYQNLRFVARACSGGSCSNDASTLLTEFPYTNGRKFVAWDQQCGTLWIFGLDSCAC
jgi:hypothetical protein